MKKRSLKGKEKLKNNIKVVTKKERVNLSFLFLL